MAKSVLNCEIASGKGFIRLNQLTNTSSKLDTSRYIICNQRKTIVNSWVRCLENNQLVITSGFLTVNFRK